LEKALKHKPQIIKPAEREEKQKMGLLEDLIPLVVTLVINIVVLSPVLWFVGRSLVGKDKAKFTDALWIVALGTIIGLAFQYISYYVVTSLGFIGTIVGAIIMLIVWLGLIKHFFDTGWLMAFAIAVVAIIIYVVIAIVLGIIFGLALISAGIL
jgi:hypothetical protein